MTATTRKQAEREFVNAGRAFAKACGIRWPGGEMAQSILLGDLCRWAERSDLPQAVRLCNADLALAKVRSK